MTSTVPFESSAMTEAGGSVLRAESMMTLRECALKKLAMGITSFDEVMRVTVSI